jgi:hypothetical protein
MGSVHISHCIDTDHAQQKLERVKGIEPSS